MPRDRRAPHRLNRRHDDQVVVEIKLDKHSSRLLERLVVALEAMADPVNVDALEGALDRNRQATRDLKNEIDENKPK